MKSGKKQQPGQRVSENRAFIDTSAILRLLVKDDPAKARAVERVLKESKDRGIVLSLLPVTILEIVWVMEKVYRLSRKAIRELVEAILNTPELKCPPGTGIPTSPRRLRDTKHQVCGCRNGLLGSE